ncbi:MAG: twin-arginine translocation signal domain-containing protein [Pseudomonadota bacterium]
MDRRDFLKKSGAATVGAASVGAASIGAATSGRAEHPHSTLRDLPIAASPAREPVRFSLRLKGLDRSGDFDGAFPNHMQSDVARFAEDVERITDGRVQVHVPSDPGVGNGSLEVGPASAFVDQDLAWHALSARAVGDAHTHRLWFLTCGGGAFVEQLGLVSGHRAFVIGEASGIEHGLRFHPPTSFVIARFEDASWQKLAAGDQTAIARLAMASLMRSGAAGDLARTRPEVVYESGTSITEAMAEEQQASVQLREILRQQSVLATAILDSVYDFQAELYIRKNAAPLRFGV